MEDIVNGLLTEFERGRISRRQLVQSLALGVAAASSAPIAATAAGRELKVVGVNHISYQVSDYARSRDFYADLFGMKIRADTGTQCQLSFGDTFLTPRTPNRGVVTPYIDHIAYTIENWNREEVEAELLRRGLDPKPDRETTFHIKDPDGFDVQICNKQLS